MTARGDNGAGPAAAERVEKDRALGPLVRRYRPSRFVAIWVATAVLFAISPVLAPGSLGSSALLSMLPFAAILAIASIGQTIVIQQRGLDFSVGGVITLAAIIVTVYPHGNGGRLPVAILLVVVACVVTGLLSGLAITRLGITPLVATLGVNALLTGAVLQITSGEPTAVATTGLDNFALAKTVGIPNTVIIAAVLLCIVAIVMRTTVIGRRFVVTGAGRSAAEVAGLHVVRYEILAYIAAALTYGAAGILVAGYLSRPDLTVGNDYLLPTVAAVVIGGTSLAGGSGSVVASAIGALFLTQLDQVVQGMGAADSVQLVIQGGIIAAGMTLAQLPSLRLALRNRVGLIKGRSKLATSTPRQQGAEGQSSGSGTGSQSELTGLRRSER